MGVLRSTHHDFPLEIELNRPKTVKFSGRRRRLKPETLHFGNSKISQDLKLKTKWVFESISPDILWYTDLYFGTDTVQNPTKHNCSNKPYSLKFSEILPVLVVFTLFAFTQHFLRSTTTRGGDRKNVKATASALIRSQHQNQFRRNEG